MLNPDRGARANAKSVESFLEERLQKHPPNSSYWRFEGTILYQDGKCRIPMELDTIEEDCN
ncbi:hypothetical protein V8C34DRAFT_285287, partial [Trichoderma compactum]